MNASVTYETARLLRDAGFPQPHPLESIEYNDGGVFLPTALHIIEQMPDRTYIQFDLQNWECWFGITFMQKDFRHHKCPHEAAALAYLAWKKGME